MKTPIHTLKSISQNNSFYIKREDLYPFSFGGNKARKAELFLKEIIDKKVDTVITYGSGSSNHCRVISNMCYSIGIDCYIITPENSKNTMNSKLINLCDTKIVRCDVSEVAETIDNLIKTLIDNNKNVYFIEGGGHGDIGTQAYVDCYEEILDFQEKFDYIFLASGTGTTQAGLICGKHIHQNNETKIIGISVARDKERGSNVIKKSIESYLNIKETDIKVDFFDNWVQGGYGKYSKNVLDTVKTFYLKEGIAMDPTYTGKAFVGMMDYIELNNIKNKKVLFIHTGGTPLFFDVLEELE